MKLKFNLQLLGNSVQNVVVVKIYNFKFDSDFSLRKRLFSLLDIEFLALSDRTKGVVRKTVERVVNLGTQK